MGRFCWWFICSFTSLLGTCCSLDSLPADVKGYKVLGGPSGENKTAKRKKKNDSTRQVCKVSVGGTKAVLCVQRKKSQFWRQLVLWKLFSNESFKSASKSIFYEFNVHIFYFIFSCIWYQDNNNNQYLNSICCSPGCILNALQVLIHLICMKPNKVDTTISPISQDEETERVVRALGPGHRFPQWWGQHSH